MTDRIKNMLPTLFVSLVFATAFWVGWICNGGINNARIEAIRAEAAETKAKAERSAREAEQTHAQAIAQIDKTYTKKLKNERNRNAAVIADMRRGALRLHDRFTCTGSVSKAGTGTGVGDGKAGTGFQLDDAEFLVSEAWRADQVVMQLQACQQVLVADRSINKKEESDGQ